jgi:hypothetical protein
LCRNHSEVYISGLRNGTAWAYQSKWRPLQKIHTYFLIYLLTPCYRVLEKLTGFQIVEKFPAFYGTRRFITTFTSASQLSLYWARSIQSLPPHPTS